MPSESIDTQPEPGEIEAAAALLRANGYRVVKIPACNREGGHGRHQLPVRGWAFHCEGVEPIPHGFQSTHRGSFGWWVTCQCGHSFSDIANENNDPTDWDKHAAEHGVVDHV